MKFKFGDTVMLNDEWARHNGGNRGRFGDCRFFVTGSNLEYGEEMITVVREGTKRVQQYHNSFFDKIGEWLEQGGKE